MNVFAVIATSQLSVEAVRLAVEGKFGPDNCIKAGETIWFVSDVVLAPAEVARKLGVAGEEGGTLTGVIVIWSMLYWGHADPNIWVWLASKIEKK